MADWKISRSPDILTTLGLGSCVGVTLWDKSRGIGGLAHIMLPSSEGYTQHNRMKFADTALKDMLETILRTGASRANLVAKIAGGAHMFSGSGAGNVLKVGERNAENCKRILGEMKIPLLANDTGGTHGRTIELNIVNGQLKIKTVGFGEKFI
ncbi:MAG: chemotaxis protein CheD [Oscillospiraceae bacterium]|nr:chemotaxis protein CheD [Oscillospiraceae bacterium]